jgi:hypothetical protein
MDASYVFAGDDNKTYFCESCYKKKSGGWQNNMHRNLLK